MQKLFNIVVYAFLILIIGLFAPGFVTIFAVVLIVKFRKWVALALAVVMVGFAIGYFLPIERTAVALPEDQLTAHHYIVLPGLEVKP